MLSYCQYITKLKGDAAALNQRYHDTVYGFPAANDDELFGRLILEINQAGLSWTTILKKEVEIKAAYADFSISTVAQFSQTEIETLLKNMGIIRNRLKIQSIIHNAQVIQQLKTTHGSFQNWLDKLHPLSATEWTKQFKKTFKFTGGEITRSFLLSTGYLEGAHDKSCPIYKRVYATKPAWQKT